MAARLSVGSLSELSRCGGAMKLDGGGAVDSYSSSNSSSSSSSSPPRSHPYRKPACSSSSFSHRPKTRAYVAELPKIQWRTLPQDLLLLLDSYIDPLTQYSIIRRVNVYWKTTLALNPRKVIPIYVHRIMEDWNTSEKERKARELKFLQTRDYLYMRYTSTSIRMNEFIRDRIGRLGGIYCEIPRHWIFQKPNLQQTLKFLEHTVYYYRDSRELKKRIHHHATIHHQRTKNKKSGIGDRIVRWLSFARIGVEHLQLLPFATKNSGCSIPRNRLMVNHFNVKSFAYLPQVQTISLIDKYSIADLNNELRKGFLYPTKLKRLVVSGVEYVDLLDMSFLFKQFDSLTEFRIVTDDSYSYPALYSSCVDPLTLSLHMIDKYALPLSSRPPIQVVVFSNVKNTFLLAKWVIYKKLGMEPTDPIINSKHPDFHGGLGYYFFKIEDIREEPFLLPGPNADRVQSIYHQLQTIQV